MIKKIEYIAYYLAWFVLGALVLYDAYLLEKNAFDFPWFDEWELFPSGNLSNIFRLYHGHLSFFYELLSEFMLKFFDWNLRYFCFLSFGVYCLTALFYYWAILRYGVCNKRHWWLSLTLLPLFAVLFGYNWLLPLMVQTYTYIFFCLLAVYFGFIRDKGFVGVVLFAISILLSALSMNWPLAIGTLMAFMGKELLYIKEDFVRRCERIEAVLVIFMTAVIFFFWPKTFSAINDWNLIDVFSYWYLELISFYIWNCLSLFLWARAFPSEVYIGLFFLHLVFLSMAFFEQYRQKEKQCLWAVVAAVMFNICVVVAVRHGEVYRFDFSFIRHNVVAFIMLPATFTIFLLSTKKYLRWYGWGLFMMMLAGVVLDVKRSTPRFYFYSELLYENPCSCMNHYYYLKTIDTWACKNGFFRSVDEYFEDALAKKLSFTNTMRGCFSADERILGEMKKKIDF